MAADDPDVLVAGETLIDFLPASDGALADVESFSRRAGGAPANVAVALSRLGSPPLFWTRVGADPFGDFLVETLDDYGVPDRFVERDPDAKTTLAFVAREGTDPSFTFYRDGTADTRLEPGTIPTRVLESVDWVVFGGVELVSDPARSAMLDLAERARKHGCTIVFDPNARPELWEGRGYEDEIGKVLPHVDLLKATPGDLREAGFDGDAETVARSILDRGPHTVVLTLGRDGAIVESDGGESWDPISEVREGYDVTSVDATGAGDAFLAGAVWALAEGKSMGEALGFANAVAAISTTSDGAMTALPDRGTVESFLASRDV